MVHISNQKIKLILVEDNKELCKGIADYLESTNMFEILDTAHDGCEGLNLILSQIDKVDICLIDMVLPKKDGLFILEELNKKTKARPTVIVLSSIGSEAITGRALDLGADYYILKPFDLNLLSYRLADVFKNKNKYRKLNQLSTITVKQKFNQVNKAEYIEDFVVNILHKLGFGSNLKGYIYLKTAIVMSILDESLLDSITKRLYPEIAKEFKTTTYNVERAIRHAIEVSKAKEDEQAFTDIFGDFPAKMVKITNGKFIYLVVEKYHLSSKFEGV